MVVSFNWSQIHDAGHMNQEWLVCSHAISSRHIEALGQFLDQTGMTAIAFTNFLSWSVEEFNRLEPIRQMNVLNQGR